jgi:predicted Ser/Thr protein kinase
MFEGKTIGNFKIEKELGSGAMGAVYKAKDDRNGQYVAIKFIAPGLGENDRIFQRFEREAKMLQQLKHPNIVKRIGTGKFHKTPFYIMEYVEGKTLGQVLEDRKYLPWDEVVEIGKQVASALHHAHSYGIIHRDLKPSNLMFTRDGKVKLTDFGIAKDLDAEALTSAGCTVGTAAYMSPEQCQGVRDLTHKSDLYSLGVVFYELLTGKKPFFADNVMDMFMMHVKGSFERPSKHVMDIPGYLETLVCQLMEKDPDKRPLNAAMVEQILDEVKDKVDSKRSVGASVAGKVALRPKSGEDRRAAETLIEARKKKKKKDKKPSNVKTILAACGLGVALLVLIAVLVFAFWPEGPKGQYLAAEKLVKKGDQLLNADDPEAAKEPWYDAERKLDNIIARPNHPYAEQAKEQLDLIKAGMSYLTLSRTLQGKTDWGQVATDNEAGRKFQETLDTMLKSFDRKNPYVVKTLEKTQPLQAPFLLAESAKLLATGEAENWEKAGALIKTLQERYPTSTEWKKAEVEFAWLSAWEEGKAILEKEKSSGVPRAASLLDAKRDAINAMALEDKTEAHQLQLWRNITSRSAGNFAERPWIRLAEEMAKRPKKQPSKDKPTGS